MTNVFDLGQSPEVNTNYHDCIPGGGIFGNLEFWVGDV